MGSYQSVELPTKEAKQEKEDVIEKGDSEGELEYVYVITHNKTIVAYADDFEEMLKYVKKFSRNLMRDYFLKDPLGHYNLYEYNIDELDEDNLAYQSRIFYRRRDWVMSYEKIEDTIRVFAVDKIENKGEKSEGKAESESEVENQSENEIESESETEEDTEKLD